MDRPLPCTQPTLINPQYHIWSCKPYTDGLLGVTTKLQLHQVSCFSRGKGSQLGSISCHSPCNTQTEQASETEHRLVRVIHQVKAKILDVSLHFQVYPQRCLLTHDLPQLFWGNSEDYMQCLGGKSC